MPQTEHHQEQATQRRLARKYKSLGYDVYENPPSDRLPDFMHGIAPGIIARSATDNVVVEIKRNASLKGSNELVELAERVAAHPEWRFELVVLGQEPASEAISAKQYDRLLDRVHVATNAGLFDMAFAYLVHALVLIARDLASRYGASVTDNGEKSVFLDLGFKGVLPDSLVERCLSALATRNQLVHGSDVPGLTVQQQVHDLVLTCDDLRAFL